VEAEFPRGTDEHLYINSFVQLPSRDDLGSVFVSDYHGSLTGTEFTRNRKDQPDKVFSTKIQDLITYIKFESEKNGPIVNNMVVRYGSNIQHVGFIFRFYRYNAHEMYGDIYTELKNTDLSNSVNKHVDEYMRKSKDPHADIPLCKGAKKPSTWVSKLLKDAGLKEMSKLSSGSINALRHSFIDH